MPTTTAAPGLMSLRAARIQLGVTDYQFMKLVAFGRLTPQLDIGRTPRYRRADVDRLGAELAAERDGR